MTKGEGLNLVFLAGGSSSRFSPLKEKNMYRFLGKTVPQYQLDKYKQFLEIKKIIVVTNEANVADIEGMLGVRHDKVEVKVQKGEGMAGATMTGIEDLDDGDDLLVANMNDYFDDELFEYFLKLLPDLRVKKESMLPGYKVEKYFPGGYLILDEDNYVTRVVEKPGEGNEPSKFVKFVFDYFSSVGMLRKVYAKSFSDNDDLYEVALTNMMNGGERFRMLEFDKRWITIKYPWHVLDVMNFFLSKIKGQQISKDTQIANSAVIKGDVVIESGVKIFENAVISGPAYIGKNCVIGNNALVRESMLGDDVVVGYCTEIVRTYIYGNVWTHKNYIGDSIVESNVSFGSNTVTGNLRLDEGEIFVKVKGEKINSKLRKLGAIVGSDTRFGVGVMIMPGVKIGAGSMVGAGIVLDYDIDRNSYVYQKSIFAIKKNKVDISKITKNINCLMPKIEQK